MIWELAASYSLLHFIHTCIPRGEGSDRLFWCLNGSGKFDVRSFYYKIRNVTLPTFPWKGIWKVKVPRRVAFFMWTVAHGQILTLDNFMLRGRILTNRCCNEESVDLLLISCPVAHSLWMYMLWLFGIDWVMPGSVADLFFCWYHWLGKHNSNIWNDFLLLRIQGSHWISCWSYVDGPFLIGLGVGASQIVLLSRIFFYLLV